MNPSITPRTIHIIDLEGAAGAGRVTENTVRTIKTNYDSLVGLGPTDHVVIASSRANALAAGYGWPGARLICRSGPHGVGDALRDVLTYENVEQRYGRCYLVTGNGGFAEAIARMSGRGLPIGVVAPPGCLSARLKLAATASREIDLSAEPTSIRRSA